MIACRHTALGNTENHDDSFDYGERIRIGDEHLCECIRIRNPEARKSERSTLFICVRCCKGIAESGTMPPMKYWEIVADKLSAAGWTCGYCSVITRNGWRWIVDAHKGDGKCYIVESDELLSACLHLELMLR